MASGLHVFDFVLERERALVLPGESLGLEMDSRPVVGREPASDRLVRLDAAGRRLVDSHLRLLMARHRHQGRGAA